MNKSCILCNGKYNFDSILIKECLNETTIAFAGGSGKADNNNRFRYCPACGEKLTKENFGGREIQELNLVFKEKKERMIYDYG